MLKTPQQLSSFEQKLNDLFSNLFNRVPFVEKMLFVFHLQTMIKAGLSIVAALKILSEELESAKMRELVGAVKLDVEQGKQLSEALAKYPKIFPPIYVNMIAAGEVAGKMEEALTQIGNQMKKSNELTSRIRGAMIYPAVILVAMLGIALEMVIFVLPKITVLFKDFNAELPVATRVLIKIVDFFQNYGAYAFVGAILFVVVFIWVYRQPKPRRFFHGLNLHLPIFGAIIKKINLARFTITLSSLLQSTIPIIDAVRITATVQGNLVYKEKLLLISERLKRGETLSSLLAQYPDVFPPMVTEMIMVGEQSGRMESMLGELAEYYANEVDTTMRNFATVIEPVIIVILGLMVAGIAVAVIMPMYSLSQSF